MKNYINKPDILKWYVYKILLIMRLTTVILMVSMLQVSAATVAQEFNYVKKGVSLIQIFKEIKKQTGYNIIWNEKKIDVTTTIDADFRKATIHDVLNKCLKNLPLSYSINDKMVMIKEAEPSFRDKIVSFFSAIDVRGRVVDENNVPLVGAVVKVKGGSASTATNSNGEFFLRNVDENAILVISFVGYKTHEVKASKNLAPVKLMPSTDKLEEVEINAGYYTVKDVERTGNISRVTAETIAKQPISNPLQALQGRVAGVVIEQSTGVPGGGFKVQIRGRSSLNTQVGNDPLYIIDGVIFPSVKISSAVSTGIDAGVSPLSLINPYDISSIEVLKDGDATAIYGSRGANGVVLITTKKGQGEDLKIAANIRQSISMVDRFMKLLNTPQYLEMRREALKNDGLAVNTTDYDINGAWEENRYTDWQKELIGNTSDATNASLSITGGNRKSNYTLSGNHLSEGTVFPGSFGFNRSAIHSSFTLGSLEDRFNITFTANYSHIKNKLLNFDPTQFIFLPPNQPSPYNEYGKYNWSNNTVYANPMAFLLQTNNSGTDNLIGNISMSYKVLKDLVFKTSIGYNSIKREELLKLPLASYSPGFGFGNINRVSNFSNINNNSVIVEPQLTYTTKLGLGNLNSLIGFSYQENSSQTRTIRATTFNSDDLMENIASAGALSTTELKYNEYKYAALFARINYNIDEKYILNLTGRRDGSSKFGPGRQFANFGAIGAAWVFSEEKWVKESLSFLSFGKLRASYGITGNDQIADYGYMELWNGILTNGSYQGSPTITPTRIANPEFAWEKTKKKEIAIQLGLFKNKINFEASYFNNSSSNQLVGVPISSSTGFTSIQANLAAEVQNSGLEFEGNVNLIAKKNWQWTTSFNLTVPKNKLVSFPGLSTSSYATLYVIGEPITIRMIDNVRGVNPQTGLYDIEDKDGNGLLNINDKYLFEKMGQNYYGGLRNSVSFKRFNLDFLISFTKQIGDNYMAGINSTPGHFLFPVPYSNQPLEVLSRWQQIGDETAIQKFTTLSSGLQRYSTAKGDGGLSIDDASFLRLKNIAFTYTLPENIVSPLKITSVEFSLQGQNIITLTRYKGLDPETQRIQNLPPLKTFLLGLKVTF